MADPGRRKFQGVLRFLVLCSTLRFTFKSRVYLEFRFLLSFFSEIFTISPPWIKENEENRKIGPSVDLAEAIEAWQ